MGISNSLKSSIFPILLVNFIGILGYSIVIPILIFIVIDFGGNGFIYGILGAMYPLFQFIGAPMLGSLSDRIGRKAVLMISQAGTFLAWGLFLLAFLLPKTEIWQQQSEFTGTYSMTIPLVIVFIARILDGFTGGNVSVANAYLSDLSTDENRSENFGKMGVSTSTGFVLGPAIAGILASTVLGEILPLILAACISLIANVVIKFRLKGTNPCAVDTNQLSLKNFRKFFQVEHRECYTEGESSVLDTSKKGWRWVFSIKEIPLLFTIYFLTFLAFSFFYAGLPIYASTVLGWSATDLGIFLAYSSFIMIIVQGYVLPKLSKKISSHTLILIGSIFLTICFYLLSYESLVILYLANTLLSIGNGLMWPSFLAVLSGVGSKSNQGKIQGYGNSMGSLASMFGLVLGGMLFESIEAQVFLIASVIFGLITFLMIGFRFKNQPKDNEKLATV